MGERVYEDGSTPATQRAAWTAYLKAFIRARAAAVWPSSSSRRPTASTCSGVLYNLLDFSDRPGVAAAGGERRDLVVGVVGAGAARRRARRQQGALLPRPPAGRRAGRRPGLALSRPRAAAGLGGASGPASRCSPRATACPAPSRRLRRTCLGRGTLRGLDPAARARRGAYRPIGATPLSPDLTAIARYTFSTPGYVMGASIVPRLPAARWTRDQQPEPLERRGAGRRPRRPRLRHARAAGRPLHLQRRARGAEPRARRSCSACRPPSAARAGDMAIWVGPRLPARRAGRLDLRRGQRLCRGPPGLRRLRGGGRSVATELPPAGPAIAGDHPGRDAQGPPELRRLPGGRARRAAPCRRARGQLRRARRRRSPPLLPGQRPAARGRWQADRTARRLVAPQPLRAAAARQPHGGDRRRRAGPCNCASTECPSGSSGPKWCP